MELLLDDFRGVYIPQDFIREIFHEDNWDGISQWQLDILSSGPDSESYWAVWDDVLEGAVCNIEGYEGWTLYQDGALFLVPPDFDWDSLEY